MKRYMNTPNDNMNAILLLSKIIDKYHLMPDLKKVFFNERQKEMTKLILLQMNYSDVAEQCINTQITELMNAEKIFEALFDNDRNNVAEVIAKLNP